MSGQPCFSSDRIWLRFQIQPAIKVIKSAMIGCE
ncbi:Uncharacterised protein [Vibrio cholerae]|nr:Uncharacterised protein [Vibrio cholerae]CSC65886.1 Uncharacterised protein [Vibrio cholerae]